MPDKTCCMQFLINIFKINPIESTDLSEEVKFVNSIAKSLQNSRIMETISELGDQGVGRIKRRSNKSLKSLDIIRKILEPYPLPEVFLKQVKIAAACGYNFAIAVTHDDQVYTLGKRWEFENYCEDYDGPLQHPDPEYSEEVLPRKCSLMSGRGIIGISFGLSFFVAWTRDGKVFSGGSDDGNGQLGIGQIKWRENKRHKLRGPRRVEGALLGKKVVKIVCGVDHSIALTDMGEVYSWGNSWSFQCGVTGKFNVLIPTKINFPVPINVKDVGAGSRVSFALTTDGQVFTWGDRQFGFGLSLIERYELEGDMEDEFSFDERDRFVNVGPSVSGFGFRKIYLPDGVKIQKIACDARACIGLTTTGRVWDWGPKDDPRDEPDDFCSVYDHVDMTPVIMGMENIDDIDDIVAFGGQNRACRVGDQFFSWSTDGQPRKTTYDDLLYFLRYCLVFFTNKDHQGPSVDYLAFVECNLEAWFDQPVGKDMIFEVDGKTILAARAMMLRCNYFENMLAHSRWKESESCKPIKVDMFSYPVFYAFVKFLHCDVIDISQEYLLELLRLADYYQMSLFRLKIISFLKEALTIQNAVAIYFAGLQYLCPDLQITALLFMASCESFDEIRAATDIDTFEPFLDLTALEDELKAFKRNRGTKRKLEDEE